MPALWQNMNNEVVFHAAFKGKKCRFKHMQIFQVGTSFLFVTLTGAMGTGAALLVGPPEGQYIEPV